MECLGRYTFVVMTSVILSGDVKMRVEHGMLTLNGDRAVEDEVEIALLRMNPKHSMLDTRPSFSHHLKV